MASIGGVTSSYLGGVYTAGGGRAGLERELGTLQQQCAEVGGCTTTPTTEKFKQEAALNSRIAAVRGQLRDLQDGAATVAQTASSIGTASGQRNQVDLYV
ncbi:FlxA-like family protein [Chitinimonas sp.]|uniref:FlxA-like family protein n=1 Tax=Chitinimonas sp. TaxID=1934313 RepID=UPI002F93EE5F